MDADTFPGSPSAEEIRSWLLETLRHSCQMEYYLDILGFGNRDSDRPHDIEGEHNKLEWEIIKGCAFAYRNGLSDEEREEIKHNIVFPTVNIHRLQYHHVMWNEYNEDATREDLMFGALDTVCALLENRPYYTKRAESPEEVSENAEKLITSSNRIIKIPWIRAMAKEIKDIKRPEIYSIESLTDFPNIGIRKATYEQIADRMQSCLRMLKDEHGYVLN